MDWLKSIKSFSKSASKSPMVNNYIVILSGLFCYNTREKALIRKRTGYDVVKFDRDIVDIIKNQYYPVFGKFILNNSRSEYLEIKSSLTYDVNIFIDENESEKVVINDIRLSFFDDTIGLGVYHFAVNLPAKICYADFIRLLRELRNFDSRVEMGSRSYSLREFIELSILRCEDNVKTPIKMRIDNHSDAFGYSGSKLKSFIAVEIDKIGRGYSMEEALYELATFTDYSTSRQNIGSHSPSQEYFDSILSNKISVFQNWTALALFDSFVLVSTQGYLDRDDTVDTIRGSYYKIFLFNLYSKFYLFKTNSDLETHREKKISQTLYSFLKNYDISHISFNFLPNLFHEKIRDAFQIRSELNSIRSKIELIESQKKEKETNLINALLFFIACLSVISVLADFTNVYEDLFGEKGGISPTMIGIGFVVIIVLSLLFWYKIINKKQD